MSKELDYIPINLVPRKGMGGFLDQLRDGPEAIVMADPTWIQLTPRLKWLESDIVDRIDAGEPQVHDEETPES